MSRWHRLSTEFLRYWEERCVAVLAADEMAVVDRVMNDKKPTAGMLEGINNQTKVLTAIRSELDRREHV